MTQFAEPAPGISSYAGHLTYYGSFDLTSLTLQLPVGIEGLEYSVMDEVQIPDHLEEGKYFLSWRWDYEPDARFGNNALTSSL